ncbi:uncharacterized protein LOC128999044 [Macrosteles quadrilineatus]|uniref:uncharacterized protein LOC128999044 n=1 Tax=Macrosteles quadrilineatus TaxID=74068 RepID=UPI0023E0A8ED|nr:uncharacterized protein LOC128999044 [Macrosteles quadrilineatus]
MIFPGCLLLLLTLRNIGAKFVPSSIIENRTPQKNARDENSNNLSYRNNSDVNVKGWLSISMSDVKLQWEREGEADKGYLVALGAARWTLMADHPWYTLAGLRPNYIYSATVIHLDSHETHTLHFSTPTLLADETKMSTMEEAMMKSCPGSVKLAEVSFTVKLEVDGTNKEGLLLEIVDSSTSRPLQWMDVPANSSIAFLSGLPPNTFLKLTLKQIKSSKPTIFQDIASKTIYSGGCVPVPSSNFTRTLDLFFDLFPSKIGGSYHHVLCYADDDDVFSGFPCRNSVMSMFCLTVGGSYHHVRCYADDDDVFSGFPCRNSVMSMFCLTVGGSYHHVRCYADDDDVFSGFPCRNSVMSMFCLTVGGSYHHVRCYADDDDVFSGFPCRNSVMSMFCLTVGGSYHHVRCYADDDDVFSGFPCRNSVMSMFCLTVGGSYHHVRCYADDDDVFSGFPCRNSVMSMFCLTVGGSYHHVRCYADDDDVFSGFPCRNSVMSMFCLTVGGSYHHVRCYADDDDVFSGFPCRNSVMSMFCLTVGGSYHHVRCYADDDDVFSGFPCRNSVMSMFCLTVGGSYHHVRYYADDDDVFSGFPCRNSDVCVPLNWMCDKDHDCPDGDDEHDCGLTAYHSNSYCRKTEFRCFRRKQHVCLPISFLCDGRKDCTDGWDEDPRNCRHYYNKPGGVHYQGGSSGSCRPSYFRCRNNRGCVAQKFVCDGEDDCADGSDEWNCASEYDCDDYKEFQCFQSYGKDRCIPRAWMCDDQDDCAHGEDEDFDVCRRVL